MDQQRPHEHRASTCDAHGDFAHRITSLDRLACCQSAEPMGSGHNSKSTVALIAVVEVYADGQDLLQYCHRWLHEDLTLLLRPTRALSTANTFGDRNTEVLMQRHEPILFDRLREQRALHRLGFVCQYLAEKLIDQQPFGEISAPGLVEQAPCAGAPSEDAVYVLSDSIDFFRLNQAGNNGVTSLSQLAGRERHLIRILSTLPPNPNRPSGMAANGKAGVTIWLGIGRRSASRGGR